MFTFLVGVEGGAHSGSKTILTEASAGNIPDYARGIRAIHAGGVIREVDGETRLVDEGLMEVIQEDDFPAFPEPVLLSAAEMPDEFGDSEFLDSMEGSYVAFQNVEITAVDPATGIFQFTDDSHK